MSDKITNDTVNSLNFFKEMNELDLPTYKASVQGILLEHTGKTIGNILRILTNSIGNMRKMFELMRFINDANIILTGGYERLNQVITSLIPSVEECFIKTSEEVILFIGIETAFDFQSTYGDGLLKIVFSFEEDINDETIEIYKNLVNEDTVLHFVEMLNIVDKEKYGRMNINLQKLMAHNGQSEYRG